MVWMNKYQHGTGQISRCLHVNIHLVLGRQSRKHTQPILRHRGSGTRMDAGKTDVRIERLNYCCMKQIQTDSGRRGSTAQVHQKDFYPKPEEPTTCCGRGCEGCVWESYYQALDRWKSLFDGPELASTGSRVDKWTAQ